MKTIVDNLAVEYRDEGEGPVILLLHGWGNTLGYFDSLCAELKGFRLVRLDLPGFGHSEIPREPWTVEQYANFVDAFCRKINIDPPTILGHSFGGRITIKGVSSGILHPKKIVLVASAGVAERWTARNVFYAGLAKTVKIVIWPLPRALYARLRRKLYATTGSDYLSTSTPQMQTIFLTTVAEDLSEDAARIAVPALLIWGRNDLVTPLLEGEKLHRLIKHSTLRIIPSAGHFVYRDNPKEVAQLIRQFV